MRTLNQSLSEVIINQSNLIITFRHSIENRYMNASFSSKSNRSLLRGHSLRCRWLLSSCTLDITLGPVPQQHAFFQHSSLLHFDGEEGSQFYLDLSMGDELLPRNLCNVPRICDAIVNRIERLVVWPVLQF